jgi:APA family basic amino acid/polyamine antiporter
MSQPALVRQLGTVSTTAIVVSNMIGVGIFTSTGFLAGPLGSPSLVIGIWFVGALLAFAGALCYAELGVNFPRSGGEYVYLSEAWGPSWGFIDGWVSFFAGFSAPISAAALGIAAYLAYFDPRFGLDYAGSLQFHAGFLTFRFGVGQILACGIVAVFTVLNVFGFALTAGLQNFLTATKLVVIGMFLGAGFAVGNGDWSHFSQPMERTSDLPIMSQLAVSLVYIYFAYSGWNAAVYVAEEIKDPDRTLPRSLLFGTALVALLFGALNCLYIYANSLEEMNGVAAIGALAASSLFGPGAAAAFSAGMAVSLLATVNAMCMIGPRVYYAMAQDRAFFPAAARLHGRWNSPWIAILAQGICCCVLIVIPTLESLIKYIGFTLFLFAALSVLALFKFRRRPEWKKTRWVSFAYPLVPGLFVVINLWNFLYFAWGELETAVLSLATVFGGALIYHLYIRQRPA